MPTLPPRHRTHATRTTAQRKQEYDQHRGSARERGYDSRWDKARLAYLAKHPRCVFCLKQGKVVQAAVVDHIIPHRGDMALFWDSEHNWQSLCKPHHDQTKQREERAAVSAEASSRAHPDVPTPRIPVVIVCGPPGSGKSTYVAEHKGPRDIVIDLDVIKASISGTPIYQTPAAWTAPALDERNRMLCSLATDTRHERAWFIVGAPEKSERALWARRLAAESVVLMPASLATCIARIKSDPRREGREAGMIKTVREWFRRAEA